MALRAPSLRNIGRFCAGDFTRQLHDTRLGNAGNRRRPLWGLRDTVFALAKNIRLIVAIGWRAFRQRFLVVAYAVLVEERLVNEVFGDSFEKFRIGGDEFAFLTQNKTAQYLEEHIWKFNKKLSDLNEKQQIPLKVAAGAHQYKPGVDESLQDIIHKADEQMYLQKIRMKM